MDPNRRRRAFPINDMELRRRHVAHDDRNGMLAGVTRFETYRGIVFVVMCCGRMMLV